MSDNHASDLDYLGFRKYAPNPFLARYIDCYWFVNTHCELNSAYNELLHPDGGMGFIFNYGSVLQAENENLMSGLFLNGPCNKSMQLLMTDNVSAAGIRFKPAGAYCFMDMPLNELKNSFRSCFNVELNNLNDYFYDEKDDLKKVQKIDSVMLKLLNPEKNISPFILNAVSIVNQYRGMLEISKLSSLLGINQRKLERVFRLQVGVSPVEYSRTIRISGARTLLKDNAYELNDISFELGFYDQAHFSKQFKSVVGLAPGEYRRRAQYRKSSKVSN